MSRSLERGIRIGTNQTADVRLPLFHERQESIEHKIEYNASPPIKTNSLSSLGLMLNNLKSVPSQLGDLGLPIWRALTVSLSINW